MTICTRNAKVKEKGLHSWLLYHCFMTLYLDLQNCMKLNRSLIEYKSPIVNDKFKHLVHSRITLIYFPNCLFIFWGHADWSLSRGFRSEAGANTNVPHTLSHTQWGHILLTHSIVRAFRLWEKIRAPEVKPRQNNTERAHQSTQKGPRHWTRDLLSVRYNQASSFIPH